MKIPKTFIPKKSLEEKTRQLLKEAKKSRSEISNISLYEELKAEFPNFTDYLFNLYSNTGIFKIKDKKGTDVWKFYIINQKKTSAFLICMIKPYTEERGTNTAEYGYDIKVRVEEKWHSLKYRIGHYCFDVANVVISTKNPLRRDKEGGIPFP